MWKFSHIPSVIFSEEAARPWASSKGKRPWWFAEGGEVVKEPSQVEGEQVDQRNVAGLLNGTLEDCIFQDGGNIFHPTSSSGTFRSPTKN